MADTIEFPKYPVGLKVKDVDYEYISCLLQIADLRWVGGKKITAGNIRSKLPDAIVLYLYHGRITWSGLEYAEAKSRGYVPFKRADNKFINISDIYKKD